MITSSIIAVLIGTKLVLLHRTGKRKMRKRFIHSKKSLNVPRAVGGIPRAMSYRALNEISKSENKSRELYFDEGRSSIFAVGEEILVQLSDDESDDELSLDSSRSDSFEDVEESEVIWV